jgi:hypothetical protein
MCFSPFLIFLISFIAYSSCSSSPQDSNLSPRSALKEQRGIRPAVCINNFEQPEEVLPVVCVGLNPPNERTFNTSKAEIFFKGQKYLVDARLMHIGETRQVDCFFVSNIDNVLHFTIYNREFRNSRVDPNDSDRIIFEISN